MRFFRIEKIKFLISPGTLIALFLLLLIPTTPYPYPLSIELSEMNEEILIKSPISQTSNRSDTITIPKWTVMVYMAGDNSLSNEALDDLNELESAGSSKNVDIIVLFDQDKVGDSHLYRILKDPKGYKPVQSSTNPDAAYDLTSPISQILDDNGIIFTGNESNMGSILTLLNFVNWTSQNYPADRYVLILWDHGDGWQGGFCWDESDNSSYLTLGEFANALSVIKQRLGKCIDILGFDACTMAQCEVVHSVKPYVDFFIGSETLEPGDGWCYNLSFSYLIENPTITPEQFARKIVDDFCTYYSKIYPQECAGYYEDYYALSAWNLTRLDSVFDELNFFSQKLKQNMSRLKPLFEYVLSNTSRYPMDGSSNYDLGDLSSKLSRVPDYTLASSSDKLYKAYLSSRIAEGHGDISKFRNATGLTINIPQTLTEHYCTLSICKETSWDEMLNAYNSSLSVINVEPVIEIVNPSDGSVVVDDVAVYGSASDDVLEVQIRIDKDFWLGLSSQNTQILPMWQVNIDVRNLSEGIHRIYARGYDGLDFSQPVERTIFVSRVGISLVPINSGNDSYSRIDPETVKTFRFRVFNNWSSGEFRLGANSVPLAWECRFYVTESATESNIGKSGNELTLNLEFGEIAIVECYISIPKVDNGIYLISYTVLGRKYTEYNEQPDDGNQNGEYKDYAQCNLTMLVNVYERRADLAITSVDIPPVLIEKKSAELKVKIENLGEKKSNSTEISFYEDPGMIEFAKKQTGELEVGECSEISVTWTPSHNARNLIIIIDAKENLKEYNRTNNIFENTVRVLHYNCTILHKETLMPFCNIELRPEQNVSIQLEIKNDGDFADSYTIYSIFAKDWNLEISKNKFTLISSASSEFYVNISPPKGIKAGSFTQITIYACSYSTGRNTTFVIDVRIVPYFSIEYNFKDNSEFMIKPKETRQYGLIVNNFGNYKEDFFLEILPYSDYDYTFNHNFDSNSSLDLAWNDSAWDISLNKTELSIDAQTISEITLLVTCPENALAGEKCIFSVILHSKTNLNEKDSIEFVFVTDAIKRIIVIPKFPSEVCWNGTCEGVLQISNEGNTDEKIELEIVHNCFGLWIETYIPSGKNLTHRSSIDIILKFIANRALAGNYSMFVNLPTLGISTQYNLRIGKEHNLSLTSLLLDSKFTQGSSSKFKIKIENFGNTKEVLRIECETPIGINVEFSSKSFSLEPFSELQIETTLSTRYISFGKQSIHLNLVNSTNEIADTLEISVEIVPNYKFWLGTFFSIFSLVLLILYFKRKKKRKV